MGFFTGHALFIGPSVFVNLSESVAFKVAWTAQIPDDYPPPRYGEFQAPSGARSISKKLLIFPESVFRDFEGCGAISCTINYTGVRFFRTSGVAMAETRYLEMSTRVLPFLTSLA
jgi:hypothetical protein